MSVKFSQSMTKRDYPNWALFLAAFERRGGSLQYDDSSTEVYLIWFYDGPEVHIYEKLWIGSDKVPPDWVTEGYNTEQNLKDKQNFEEVYKPSANGPVVPK